jgi:hypothetical protein
VDKVPTCTEEVNLGSWAVLISVVCKDTTELMNGRSLKSERPKENKNKAISFISPALLETLAG